MTGLRWRKRGGALAVYVGVRTLPQLAERLLGAGLDPATPAIAVENATRLDERGIRAPLGRTVAAVAGAGLDGPTLVLIGQVVALGDTIQQAVDLAA